MANHISHAALPYPLKGCRFSLLVPYLDADGDPLDPTTPDTERSIDVAAFADCTEEVTTISGSNGCGYITLTGDEMNCSALAIAFKVASGPKATLATLYPRVLPIVLSGTAQAGAAGTITLPAGAVGIDEYYEGMIVRTTGGTGGGGGSGSRDNQARIIIAYNGSTKVATISPNWETNPDGTTTVEVLRTDVSAMVGANLLTWLGVVPNALVSNRVDSSAGAIAANAITASATAADFLAEINAEVDTALADYDAPTFAELDARTDAIEADTQDIQARIPTSLVSGRMDSSVGAIAADALTAAAIADSAITKIRSVASGAATSGGTSSTIIDSSRTEGDPDHWKGDFILFTSGIIAGKCRLITGFDPTTDTITFAPFLTDPTDTGDTYEIIPAGRVDVNSWLGSVANALVSGRVDSSVGAVASSAIGDAGVAADMDAYHAKCWVVKESTTTDHYAVVFFKNGQPVTSGITSPTIQVIKASDGSDLIASTALTEVGSLGIYKKDESTNKMTAGAIYFAKVTATIDGSARTWYQQVGRDSA